MLGFIQTERFFLDGGAEQVHLLHQHEEGTEHAARPGCDDNDTANLRAQELTVATVEDTRAVDAKDFGDVVFLGHETNPEDAKGTAEAVHRRRFEGIVNLELEQELAGEVNDHGTEHTANKRGPRFGGGATGGDGDETGERAVADGDQIPHVVQVVVERHGGETTTSGSESGGDGSARDDARGSRGNQAELGTRVEAVPADPQDEGTENDERSGVTRHRVDAAVRSETARTRTNNPRTHQTSATANHVYNAGTGEIEHTRVEKFSAVGSPRTQPAFSRPAPVHDARVNKAGEEEGVSEVRLEARALGDRARHDGRRRRGEGPLEQETRDVIRGFDALHGKVTRTNERVRLGSVRCTKSKAIAKQKPRHGTDASVENILNQNVLRVFRAHGTRAQHREPGLHEKHQVGRGEQKLRVTSAANNFE